MSDHPPYWFGVYLNSALLLVNLGFAAFFAAKGHPWIAALQMVPGVYCGWMVAWCWRKAIALERRHD